MQTNFIHPKARPVLRMLRNQTLLKHGPLLTGSRAVPNNPLVKETSDWDYVVHVNAEDREMLNHVMDVAGFSIDKGPGPSASDEEHREHFKNKPRWEGTSFRANWGKLSINILAVPTYDRYRQWSVSTQVSRILNLTKREQRCIVYKAIIDSIDLTEPEPKPKNPFDDEIPF